MLCERVMKPMPSELLWHELKDQVGPLRQPTRGDHEGEEEGEEEGDEEIKKQMFALYDVGDYHVDSIVQRCTTLIWQ